MSLTKEQDRHLSASQLLTFELCGEAYRRQYVEREKAPRNVDLLRGSTVHKSRRMSLTRRLEGQDLPPIEEVQDVTATFSREEWESGEVVLPEDMGPQKAKDTTRDSAIRLAMCDRTELQPDIYPEGIERKTVLEIDGLPPIVAYTDVDDVHNVVHELKTGGPGSHFPQGMADESEQITVYCLALARAKSIVEVAAVLEKVRDLKSGPRAGMQRTLRQMPHFQTLLNRFAVMCRSIEAGVFVPATQGSWKCSPKWCEWYSTCPYVSAPVSVAMMGEPIPETEYLDMGKGDE